jgi:hypothetical protein
MTTFDENGQPIEDAEIIEERPLDRQTHAAQTYHPGFQPYTPQLGAMIEESVIDAAADLDQLFTIAVIGVAALYLVPRILDSLKGR